MCASLNALWSAEPRCPEVPNATRCAGTAGSGWPAKYAVTSRGIFASIEGSAGWPARGLILADTGFLQASEIRRGIVDRFCWFQQGTRAYLLVIARSE